MKRIFALLAVPGQGQGASPLTYCRCSDTFIIPIRAIDICSKEARLG